MQIICFRCRKPLQSGAGYCVNCGASYEGGEADPEVVSAERTFLVARAMELSDPEHPAYMGYDEPELGWKADRIPPLPLGGPREVPQRTPEETREALLHRLATGGPWERGTAAVFLARDSETAVLFALLKQLGDRDSSVRACVLWALGQSGNPLIVPPLLEFERMERDTLVRSQLAATLYRLTTSPLDPNRTISDALRSDVEGLTARLVDERAPDLFLQRGRLRMREGTLLKAAGDFSRVVDEEGVTQPLALLYRSQCFLLMGKPLFALDDLVACPEGYSYPPIFHFHRMALTALAGQIVNAAREKGLTDYARLFERRLDKLATRKE